MVFTQGDGGYIQMNQEGFIDLGEFDLSQFGPTAANPNVFTNPQLPGVGQVAPVDAQGNLGAAYGAVLGMQQAIPDPGVGYEQARAQRMQALMEDLGLLDQGVAAAQQQVAKQRERPLNFGNLPIGAEANALFGRAYDFAEGAIGQGRISAEAKLRAQANQALDQILSGNYQAGYQGQVQQALDIPNQALTAAGQFNSVGQSNQQASLQVLLEEAANRRAEMNATQAQQLAQFGEQGTDARYRLGLTNSNNQLGITEAGQDKRNYYNAKYTDLLAQNKWFRELPFEQQKLALDVLQGNQQAAVTMAGNQLQAQTSLTTNSNTIAAQTTLENLRSKNDTELKRLEAELAKVDPTNVLQRQLIESQITENRAQAANYEAKAATYGKKGLTTTAQQNQYDKDAALIEQLKPKISSVSGNPQTPDEFIATWAAEDLLKGKSEGRQNITALVNQTTQPLWTQVYNSKLKKTIWVNPAAKDPSKPKDGEFTTVDPNKDIQATRKAATEQYTALYDALAGSGMGSAGLTDLKAAYAARMAEAQYIGTTVTGGLAKTSPTATSVAQALAAAFRKF